MPKCIMSDGSSSNLWVSCLALKHSWPNKQTLGGINKFDNKNHCSVSTPFFFFFFFFRISLSVEVLAELCAHLCPDLLDAGRVCPRGKRGDAMRLRRPADGRLLGFRGIAASGDVTDPDGGVSASWNHVNGEIEVKVKIGQCLTKFWSGWLPNIYD